MKVYWKQKRIEIETNELILEISLPPLTVYRWVCINYEQRTKKIQTKDFKESAFQADYYIFANYSLAQKMQHYNKFNVFVTLLAFAYE